MEEEYEDEYDEEQDESDYRADMEYDRWRDDQSESLRDGLWDLWRRFVKCEQRGYYKNNSGKFVEHTKALLEELKEAD